MPIRAGTSVLGTESGWWQESGERGLGISLDTGTVANVWEATIHFHYSDSTNDVFTVLLSLPYEVL
jgi:hypothetical protein